MLWPGLLSPGKWRKKYAIMHFANEICLSKEQVPECAPNAVARAIEPREVEFVCKPLRNRDVKAWVRKAEKRQTVTELNSQQKSFSATVELPSSCVRDY